MLVGTDMAVEGSAAYAEGRSGPGRRPGLIVVAHRHAAEAESLRKLLGCGGSVQVITSPAQFDPFRDRCDLLLVDAQFTDDNAQSFLQSVRARRDVPVVVIIPPDRPEWALESLKAGAIAYVLKIGGYGVLVDHAVKDAKSRHDERVQLREALQALKALKDKGCDVPADPLSPRGAQPASRPAAGDKRGGLIDEIVRRFRAGEIAIPAYPDINLKLQKLIRDQADLPDIADLLRNDPAICSKLISLSNSARYGSGREIKSLEQAINLLGMKETLRYVDVIAQQSLYCLKHPEYEPLLERLWVHSIACAHAAELVSRHTLVGTPDEVFIMGLLHDIGVLLLLRIMSDVRAHMAHVSPMSDADLQAFITEHHGRFGKSVLDRWKFPETYGRIALDHEQDDITDASVPELLVVHFANRLVKNADYRLFPGELRDLTTLSSARLLRLKRDDIAGIEQALRPLVEESRLSLG